MTKQISNFPNYTINTAGEVVNTVTGLHKSSWLGVNGYYHVDLYHEGKSTKVAVHRLLALHFLDNPENKRVVNHIDGNKQNNSLTNLEWATDSENQQHAYDTKLQPYRRNYQLTDYDDMLQDRFLQGETITAISKTENQSLTQLSLHLRESAKRLGLLVDYEAQLKLQKLARAKAAGHTQRVTIVLQMIDKSTNTVLKIFSSAAEAAEYLKVKSSGPISNVLAGRQNSAYGYFWKKI